MVSYLHKMIPGWISAFLFCMLTLHIACQDQHHPTPFEQFVRSHDTVFDLVILNAHVIDGRGSPSQTQDLLVKSDTIAYLGEVDTSLIRCSLFIDAQGMIVSPGFIDPHAHGDPLSSDSTFENFLAMGVTTILLGQDGNSPVHNEPFADPTDYFERVSQNSLGTNVAFLAGHGNIRTKSRVGGKRSPTIQDLARMKGLLRESLEAGCFGMSTGLEYMPGMLADSSELMLLAAEVGNHDGILMSHMRSEDDDRIENSIRELARQGDHCRVHISHLKVVYGKGAERGNEILRMIKKQREHGISMTADVYPYLAGYTGISIVFPSWAKTPSSFEKALLTRNQELRDYLHDKVVQRNGPGATLFGSGPFSGMTLAEVEEKSGRSFVDILLQLGPFGASGAYFVMDEELQQVFIIDPDVMICTDGAPQMRHPRGYGTYARMIEKYVVKDSALSLESLVHKATGLPAQIIGIEKRGHIATGNFADLLIFDPRKVRERATFSDPFQLAEGMEGVIVNGKVVLQNGTFINSDAGRLLRKDQIR